MILINGDNNIVIRGVKNSNVVVNYNDYETIKKYIDQLSLELVKETRENIKEEIEKSINLLKSISSGDIFPNDLTSLPFVAIDDVFGRRAEINEIAEFLKNEDRVVLLNGIGGIGKTTIAKLFVNFNRQLFKHVCWIEVVGNVKEAFVYNTQLIDSLGLQHDLNLIKDNKGYVDIAFDLITNRLRKLNGKNLLIIDNVNEEIENLDILNKIMMKPHWKVLVTSRNTLVGFKIYEISHLKINFALDLFYHYYKYEKNDVIVEQILELVSYHTLTIEVLAKTFEKRLTTLVEILEIVKKKKFLSKYSKGIKIPRNNNKKISGYIDFLIEIFPLSNLNDYDIWVLYQFVAMPAISIKFRNGKKSVDLLNLLDINDTDRLALFPDTLSKLSSLGWLMKNEYSFKIHEIIQEVVLNIIGEKPDKCISLFESLTNNFNQSYKNDRILGRSFFPFVYRIEEIFVSNQVKEIGSLYSSAAVIHEDALGDYKKSLSLLSKALCIHKFLGEEKHLSIVYNNISTTHRLLGNNKKALHYALQAIEIRERLGDDSLAYLGNSYQTISIIYRKIGDLNNALIFCKKAIHIRERLSNDFKSDKRVAKLYNNISSIYRDQNKYDTALDYLFKSIEIKQNYYPEDELSLSYSYSNLSRVYLLKNMIAEAYEYALKDFDISKRILTPNDPDLAQCYHNLAKCKFLQKEYSNALLYLKKEQRILEIQFDENHPDLIESYNLEKIILSNKNLKNE